MMSPNAPHFLLFSKSETADENAVDKGRWHFVLESVDGSDKLEAWDDEPTTGGRLELMAVIRGLEALDQPSKVTLVTPSEYVERGMRFGLEDWRENHWCWERFGRQVPVKNQDLWQRIDRALSVHDVRCKLWRVDTVNEPQSADVDAPAPVAAPKRAMPTLETSVAMPARHRRARRKLVLGKAFRRLCASVGQAIRQPRLSNRPAA